MPGIFPSYPYAIAPGWNNILDAVLVETYTGFAPSATPIPRGTVVETTLDRRNHHQGRKIVVWRWGWLLFTNLDALVVAAAGDWDAPDPNVTIRTRTVSNAFEWWNAVMHQLVEGTDFKLPIPTKATEIAIPFDLILKLPEP
jgi:hypothetical protein